MTKPPYPEFPPNYWTVGTLGGFSRTCLIIELLSLKPLSGPELAFLQEQMEATLVKAMSRMSNLEKSQIVTPDRFDSKLIAGLRLKDV